jgi:hypothetical protein
MKYLKALMIISWITCVSWLFYRGMIITQEEGLTKVVAYYSKQDFLVILICVVFLLLSIFYSFQDLEKEI